MTDAPDQARPMDPHPAAAPAVDPVVELAELLIVTRRFRDADLTLEAAQAILARVREHALRAMAALSPTSRQPGRAQHRAAGDGAGEQGALTVEQGDLLKQAQAAMRRLGVTIEPTPTALTSDNIRLASLLAPQVVARLRAAGIEVLTDLAQITALDAAAIPGIGPATLAHIAGVMGGCGITFKADPPSANDEAPGPPEPDPPTPRAA